MNNRTSINSKSKRRPVNNTSKKKNINASNTVKVKKVANNNGNNIKRVNKNNRHLENIDVDGYRQFNTRKSIDNYRLENEEERKNSPIKIIAMTFFIGIIISIGYLLFTHEYFNLETIEVEENTKYSDEIVIENCSLTIGQNVFKQLFIKEYNKSELPYVSKIKYKYSFPNTIKIEVEERYPEYIAKDKNTERYYMIDNQGYLLEECSLEQKSDELLIEGLVFEEEVEFGKKIDEVYIKKIEKYREIKQLIEDTEISTNITKVCFNTSLTIITIDDKLNVVFSNDSNLEYKVSFLKGIINQNGGIVEGTIDMSVENPVYSKYD